MHGMAVKKIAINTLPVSSGELCAKLCFTASKHSDEAYNNGEKILHIAF
jgi:hypothetical protein